jgi:putative toxin-antitoxin system antitoxin component (TIGR02293 family)
MPSLKSRPKRTPGPQLALESVINRAAQVIGDRDEAMRWLGTPVRALDYATPISLLATREGVTRVEDVLGQMEHGVW